MENNLFKITKEKTWLGSSIEDIYNGQGPWNFSISPVTPSKYHHVLYQLPVNLQNPPKPHYTTKLNYWDDDHVRMPYSPHNLYPVTENGVEVIKQRWDVIKKALSVPIKSVKDLENAMNKYNKSLPEFSGLHELFEEILDEEVSVQFFETALPLIIKLALALPEILPGSIPLLKKHHCKSISLSQLQIASLMANAFLCTFPWRKSLVENYPGVNFTTLFASKALHSSVVAEKLMCICHYFTKVTRNNPKGVVTFERKFIPRGNMPRWDKSDNNLGNTKIHISSTGTIEDNGLGMLQVDFANKNVGGGVMGYGSVQEEIRFVICPELIISRLFVERLGDHEAVLVMGAERYSNYSGYGETFKWAGNCEDETPYDEHGRRKTTITIIDATLFFKPAEQFYPSAILRELNKAFVGFSSREKQKLAPVATGNWGCGAFRGSVNLKSLIQLMACSAANRDLVYFSFGDEELTENFYNMHLFLANNQITITQLWRFLCKFNTLQLPQDKLYSYIQQAYFDSKKQPTIKTFFGFKTKQAQIDPEPSTSENSNKTLEKPREKAVETPDDESDSDVIMSSQSEEILYKKQTKTKKRSTTEEIVKKLPTNIVELIDIIDGNANKSTNRECLVEDTFLSEIDKLRKKSKNEGTVGENTALQETGQMDLDEIAETSKSAELSINESKVSRRKITDYFGKSSTS